MDTSLEPPPNGQRPKVLLICDRLDELASWERSLPADRLDLIPAASVEQAFENWPDQNPDLIVVDVNDEQPDCSETCRQLRQEAAVPLVILFGRVDEDCLLRAYRAGADDCLVKPVSPQVFLAKVNAWLRRSWSLPVAVLPDLEAGGLRLDMRRHEVVVEGEKAVRLTNLEFRLLALFMSYPGWTLEPDEILQRVWGFPSEATRDTLKNTIRRLRKKIEPDPAHPVYLVTDPGQGYRFHAG
jgi:two-component system, OmpR family, KDP operon response regulator KdpE